MKLMDVHWTPHVNMLQIQCACGALFVHPANYSMVRCPLCNQQQLWHSGEPFIKGEKWSTTPPIVAIDHG